MDFPSRDEPQAAPAEVVAFAGQEWGPPSSRECADPDTLVIATWNAWFQGPEPDRRNASLVSQLEASDTDLILLQEATVPLLERLRSSAWVRERYQYVRTPFRQDAIPSHGLMVLSRLPIVEATVHRLQTRMGRRLLAARVAVRGGSLAVAAVHLDSMKGYAEERAAQLATAFGVLAGERDAVVGGDFNFCSSWPAENRSIDERYADLWPLLRPAEPGFTRPSRDVRFDRLLLKGAAWRPESIALLGTEPIDRRAGLFASDHFGLSARLRRAG